MKLEKASIEKIIPAGGKSIKVQFNPNKYKLTSGNSYKQKDTVGRPAPPIQWVQGEIEVLTMELFFDTYEAKKDVRERTKEITDLLKIDPNTHEPPVLLFQWGKFNFTCVLEKVAQDFILFLPDGNPARAKLNVTFKEFTNDDAQQENPNRSSTFDQVYIVQTGDSLAGIAAKVYEDPRLWRHIAEENDIANPLKTSPGLVLGIPPLS